MATANLERPMAIPTYRLTRDVLIPAGTVVSEPPTASTRWTRDYEALVGIDRDHTAYFTLNLADGIATGLIQQGPADVADFKPAETAKVVGIRGAVPPTATGEADPALVAVLRDLLGMAESGQLRCFVGTGFVADGSRAAVWSGNHDNVYEMRGAIAWLGDEYVARITGEIAR